METLYKDRRSIINFVNNNYRLPNVEDLVDTALFNFYIKHYNKHDPSLSNLKTYFTNYLILCIKTEFQAKYRKKTTISIDELNDDVYLKDILIEEEEINMEDMYLSKLQHVLNNMKERHIKWLNYIELVAEGKSYEDIATIYGIKHQDVKNRIFFTRSKIIKKWNELYDEKMEFGKNSINANINIKYYRNKLKCIK